MPVTGGNGAMVRERGSTSQSDALGVAGSNARKDAGNDVAFFAPVFNTCFRGTRGIEAGGTGLYGSSTALGLCPHANAADR